MNNHLVRKDRRKEKEGGIEERRERKGEGGKEGGRERRRGKERKEGGKKRMKDIPNSIHKCKEGDLKASEEFKDRKFAFISSSSAWTSENDLDTAVPRTCG